MTTYALEVRRLAVRLVAFDGEARGVDLFLRSGSERRPGAERLGDRLNDPATLFLASDADGEVELVQLAWVAYVDCGAALPEADEMIAEGASRATVELELVSGEMLAGELLYELPAARSRVLDLLNSPTTRFILMRCAERWLYVQRGAVVRARA